jgi:hypothetical protein
MPALEQTPQWAGIEQVNSLNRLGEPRHPLRDPCGPYLRDAFVVSPWYSRLE